MVKPMTTLPDVATLLRRALAAYYRKGGRLEQIGHLSGVVTYRGKVYVVIEGEDGKVLKVYRVRTSGLLKALRRVPRAILK